MSDDEHGPGAIPTSCGVWLDCRSDSTRLPGHDLLATALINEAYLRLVDWKNIQWADRAHFFGMAANMMGSVLVNQRHR